MRKVLVLGCCGAGKSTFAKQLHEITKIPIYHLDQWYWQPNWVEPSKTDWVETVNGLIHKDQWILDGNYGGTLDLRLAKVDTVIFLDRPRWLCLYRIMKRIISNYGQIRSDMAPGCPERFSWSFIKYVYRFNDKKRPKILQKLEVVRDEKEVVILESDQAVKTYLKSLSLEK